MMNLLDVNAAIGEYLLDSRGEGDRVVRIRAEWLDQCPYAAP